MGGARLAYAGGPEDEPGNFGDQLSPILLRDLFGARSRAVGMNAADFVSVGSILGWLEESTNPLRPHVWGSGFIEDGGPWGGPTVRVHALRGQLSRERMRAEIGRRRIVIDVLGRPRAVAEQIAASGFVLSSSLHGLIAAEALGVPNRWTPSTPLPDWRKRQRELRAAYPGSTVGIR